MSWLLTWFFFPRSRKELSSPSSHTETKGGFECYDSDSPCVSPCHAALHFYSVAIPVHGWAGASCKVVSSQSFRWGTALFPPHHLLICPPRPSLCQVPLYCLSSPNLFSLPCFVTWDLDSVSISPLPAGLMLGFVSRGTELKGPCKALEGEGVSFRISGVLIFSGVWLFVDFTPSDTRVPPRPPKRPYCGLAPAHSHTLPAGLPTHGGPLP